MKRWIRNILLLLALMMPFTIEAREDELANLLQECLLREMNSPDSIEHNLALLEKAREGKQGVQKAMYDACLAMLYATRSYSDVTGQWRERSIALFKEALADPELLYNAKTKDWLPIVKQGKDEKIYGSNMLYVIWNAADECERDSIMTEKELLDIYTAHGNVKPAKIKADTELLKSKNDSIRKNAPRLQVRMAEVYYTGDSLRLDVDSSNVSSLTWSLHDRNGKLMAKNPLLAPLEPGRYMLKVSCQTKAKLNKKPQVATLNFVVSRLQAFAIDMPHKAMRVTVVDAKSGAPLPEAQVHRNRQEGTLKVSLGADSCLPEIRYYERYNYNAPSTKFTTRIAMFSDRAIYRPGQNVKFSAVVFEQKHWDVRTKMANVDYKVKLTNNEGKLVADTIVTTDDFGTIATEFAIPKDASLGWYTIWMEGHVHNVMVEEYKRPEFYVEMNDKEVRKSILPLPEDSASSQKDSIISIAGRAMNYDGTPLRGARVTAQAIRQRCWWWRREPGGDNHKQLDTLFTDMEGRFVLQVPVSRLPKYRYSPTIRVNVDVLSAHGETQSGYTLIRLFDDPPMVAQAKEWLECPVDTFDADTPARLEFRNTENQPTNIFLMAFAGEQVVMDTMMQMSDTLQCMDVPYEERFTDGIRLVAVYVCKGEVHFKNIALRKRLPNTQLSMHWDTFRDYTQPGATEQWSLRVLDAKGTPVKANVMLTMYDASLNAFLTNDWSLSVHRSHYLPYSQLRYRNAYAPNGQSHWQHFDVWMHKIKKYEFSHLDMKYILRHGNFGADGGILGAPRAFVGGITTNAFMTRKAIGQAAMEKAESEEAQDLDDETDFSKIEMRMNFSETALFMPQLRTDADGRLAITFTMPQSLTTWQLNGVAHTQEMHTGQLTERIVARKALMSKLHLPRFVREGDNFTFSASITNSGDVQQKGKVLVEVLDANSDKVFLQQTLPFKVEASGDTTYHFQCLAPQGIEGLRFRVVASATKDSDGEQREIPVLNSVVDLAESQALTIEPGKTIRLSLEGMFPEMALNRKMIIEKVFSPIQTAIDALPKVVAPQSDDALSYAAAYYAALKLGKADTTLYINKLACMQKSDGSMPWFDGLVGNVYLTREVGYLLARLSSTNPMSVKVLNNIKVYLSSKLEEELERRKEYDKDWEARLTDLRTLYILVKDGKTTKEQSQLVNKVLKRLPHRWEEMDSEYIALALIAKYAQNETVLNYAAQVLNKRLRHSDGSYLAYRGGSHPTIDRRLHIHTQVMEAWQTVFPNDSTTIKGMQLWLLNQKRTQGWKSPIDCINAVFALTGGDISYPDSTIPNMVRDTLDTNTSHKIHITNSGNEPMWVAVYAEYSLPMDSVENSGLDFALTRTFSNNSPKVGDKVKESILIEAKRDCEFVVLTVPRASAMEPVSKLSTYGWQKGVNYYMQVRDNRTDYFIPSLPHGKYILALEYTIEREGQYATGVPSIKCCYAEEFRAHGISERIVIKN